jgi:acetylornithine deacetylase/succinyl-diaminopimelate desuccinylase-like protein
MSLVLIGTCEKVISELMNYIDSNVDNFLKDLSILCQEPSISAQNTGIDECVEVLVKMMTEIGITVKVIPIENGNPIVFGELKNEDASKCLGFYNHYDVQPPEPLELWNSPPFKPTIRDGKMFARGVVDNKGSLVSRLEAVKTMINVLGEIPVNLKFIVDGEEEIGSPNLPTFVKENKDLLMADDYLWEGSILDRKERPQVYLGIKGMLNVELSAKGAIRDVASRNSSLIPNPAWKLVWVLSSIKDSNEKILIPNWYDEVIPPTKEEIRLLENMPIEVKTEMDTANDLLPKKGVDLLEGIDLGLDELGLKEYLMNLTGIESLKALLYSPTCNISGFNSGYAGPGPKSIIPSEARVKLGFRLVHAQKPDILFERLKEHLNKGQFGTIEVIKYGANEPSRTPLNDPFVTRNIETAKKVYGSDPIVWPTHPGSSPMYLIRNWVGSSVVMAGGPGYYGHSNHAPNENMRISDYVKAIKFIVTLMSSYKNSK